MSIELAAQQRCASPGFLIQSETFEMNVAAYRALNNLLGALEPEIKRLENALNVLGSDIRFDVDNVHEDIETDNGETQDLGQLRKDIVAYYARPAAKKDAKNKPA